MKLIHLSDLHIGKRVNEMPMLEDQQYILNAILAIVDEEQPDGVIIAGDVYDKSVPSAEAVQVLDEFLVRLAKRHLPVYIISGNHDSPERLAFGGRLLSGGGIFISPVYNGTVDALSLQDAYGEVRLYLLPFIKPAHVRRAFPDEEIESYTDAVRVAVEHMAVDETVRNVIVTHQFVTGASRSESEEVSVGGSDNVDASVFDAFDYVALGHIHGPQSVTRETVRYCGTPLKYSFSEAGHQKSVTVVELLEKGNTVVRTVPLTPLRDMRELRGTYDELTFKGNINEAYQQDYIHVTLTDEEDVLDALAKLRTVYPNIMKLDYDNQRTRQHATLGTAQAVQDMSPYALFAEFYEKQNNQPMSEEQQDFMTQLIGEIWGDDA